MDAFDELHVAAHDAPTCRFWDLNKVNADARQDIRSFRRFDRLSGMRLGRLGSLVYVSSPSHTLSLRALQSTDARRSYMKAHLTLQDDCGEVYGVVLCYFGPPY